MGASKNAKRLARALERAEARHQITNPGTEMSFDVLMREALTELCVELDVRDARDLRRIRKAARRLNAAAEVRARLPGIAEAVAPPSGTGGFGPPRWHPEHRLHSEN